MAAGTGVTGDDVGKRFEEIESLPDIENLKFPGRKVSGKPMVSRWYANCNGVVLLDHGVAGMTHYNHDSDPEEYIPELINEIFRFAGIHSMTAVVIGGDSDHFGENKEILEYCRIPVVGQHCDGWMDDDEVIGHEGENAKKMYKKMVVVPETREVIMYSKPVGYLRLSPPAP